MHLQRICAGSMLGGVGVAALLLAAAPNVAGPNGAPRVNVGLAAPTFLAVRFHHGQCPYCVKIEPEIPAIVAEASKRSVLFVDLNMTDEAAQQQSAFLLAALGLADLWSGDLSKVATVTFIDWKSKAVLSADGFTDADVLRAAIRKLPQ